MVAGRMMLALEKKAAAEKKAAETKAKEKATKACEVAMKACTDDKAPNYFYRLLA